MKSRVLFVNPVPQKKGKKTMAHAKRKKKHHRKPAAAKRPRKRARARAHHRRNPAVVANPRVHAKKRKRPRTVYKLSKRGTRRRVRRVNPGFSGVASVALAALLGLGTGVAVRVGTHMAAPGNGNAAKIAGGAAALAGVAMAVKMKNPLFGMAVAVGALDAALQNDVVFKTEMALAPAATQKALGAVEYQNMRAMQAARSTPGYASMGQLPGYARMGAIVAQNMAGYGDTLGAMRTRNPFE